MPRDNQLPLSKEEIEEELKNNDLLNTGGLENQMHSQEKNIEEKKSILKGITQSKGGLSIDPSLQPSDHSTSETSESNLSLSLSSVNTNSQKKLKLPRKSAMSPNTTVSDKATDIVRTNLLDYRENVITSFTLPLCINDGAPSLVTKRQIQADTNVYYKLKNETPFLAFKRMLACHERWKEAFIVETNKIESHTCDKDLDNADYIEDTDSLKNDQVEEEDEENDPYRFVSNSPNNSPVGYNGTKKRETYTNSDSLSPLNNQQLPRKPNRDSDCEEVEPISKLEKPKVSEWKTYSRTRSKRNRKQLLNQEKCQTFEGHPDVQFDFDNKWDARSSTWRDNQSPNSSSISSDIPARRNFPKASEIEEKNVQCPICQKNFVITKVEAHAATCEGFSNSPMDVEEEAI